MKKLSAENLKQELWSTLEQLRANKLDHKLANAIATQSREIVRVVKLEMEALKSSNKQDYPKSLQSFVGQERLVKQKLIKSKDV